MFDKEHLVSGEKAQNIQDKTAELAFEVSKKLLKNLLRVRVKTINNIQNRAPTTIIESQPLNKITNNLTTIKSSSLTKKHSKELNNIAVAKTAQKMLDMFGENNVLKIDNYEIKRDDNSLSISQKDSDEIIFQAIAQPKNNQLFLVSNLTEKEFNNFKEFNNVFNQAILATTKQQEQSKLPPFQPKNIKLKFKNSQIEY